MRRSEVDTDRKLFLYPERFILSRVEGERGNPVAILILIIPAIIDLIPNKPMSYLEKDILPQLVKKGHIFGYVFAGEWFDVSTPKVYERVLKEWKK